MEKYDINDIYAVTVAPVKYYKAFGRENICTMLKFGYDTVAKKSGNGYYDIITDKYFDVFEYNDFEYLRMNLNKWYVFGKVIPLRIYLKEAKENLTIQELRSIYYKMNNKIIDDGFNDKFMSNIILTKKYIEDNISEELKNMYLDKLFSLTSCYINRLIYSSDSREKIAADCSLDLLALVKELGECRELSLIQKNLSKCKKKVFNSK